MKTLIVIRHAKSDWSQNLQDHERPLNTRGLQDAPDMGRRLAEHLKRNGAHAELLVSSSAVRARTTAELVAGQLDYAPQDIRIERGLYAASPGSWLQLIHSLPEDRDCVLMFGHNPEITSVVSRLSGEYREMATCTVALMQFDADNWHTAGTVKPVQLIMDYPKRPYR